jgi:hypothetical protein
MRGPVAAGLLALLTLSGCVATFPAAPAATSCPSRVAPRALEPITKGLGAPSAALVTADDRLWLDDSGNGTVGRLNPDGSFTLWAVGLRSPGAMVELGDGSILVAERATGDIVHVIPGLRPSSFRTAGLGAPGISAMVKAPGEEVFAAVPGAVIRVGRGREVVVLRGLSDQPGLALDPSGSLLVNDRNVGLQRVDRAGSVGLVIGVPPIRSFAVDHHGWLVFVSETGELWDWMAGKGTRLLSGVAADATIAVDQADNILVVDPHGNRVLRLVRSFIIRPTVRIRAAQGKTVRLCLPIERASAYTQPVTMTVAAVPPGITATVQRQPAVAEGATLNLLSDLPDRLKQGAIVLDVVSGTLKQRFFLTLDFGG